MAEEGQKAILGDVFREASAGSQPVNKPVDRKLKRYGYRRYETELGLGWFGGGFGVSSG